MPEGGALHIRTFFDAASGEVVAEFADEGHGIPEGIRARVFDPFFTTKPVGAGLGLAVCYGIVTAHGGSITVEPNDSRGTTVRVALPADETDAKVLDSAASGVQTSAGEELKAEVLKPGAA
jgi:signal transduction histidine kinase